MYTTVYACVESILIQHVLVVLFQQDVVFVAYPWLKFEKGSPELCMSLVSLYMWLISLIV